MEFHSIGIDLGKTTFHLAALSATGEDATSGVCMMRYQFAGAGLASPDLGFGTGMRSSGPRFTRNRILSSRLGPLNSLGSGGNFDVVTAPHAARSMAKLCVLPSRCVDCGPRLPSGRMANRTSVSPFAEVGGRACSGSNAIHLPLIAGRTSFR